MNDALTFVFRLFLFAGMHSLLASPPVKSFLTNHNQSRQQIYRLFYNLISLATLGWVMTSYRNTPVLYVAPGVWSLIMHLIQATLLAILLICVQQTGAAEFLGLPNYGATANRPTRLITNGCYGIVRHPLYLFSMLFLLFNPVITNRWLIFAAFSAVYFVFGALLEERRLLREFGDEYKNYQQRTPFMIPDMSLFRKEASKKR